jgi:ubiquinone/menaquinone biosynthesis C-methylase UbiE
MGGDLLDVGTGAGQFINCVALSGCFRSATTTDPTTFNKYVELSEEIVRLNDSLADLPFDDGTFDTVVCMEVLEHLPEEIFHQAIAELRRVCRGQLVMTVPYREPEPISKTHVRRFEDDDLLRLFPSARFVILQRPNKPWVLVEEYPHGYASNRHGAERQRADDLARENADLRMANQRLRNRKALRAADWLGHKYRAARSAVADRFRPDRP